MRIHEIITESASDEIFHLSSLNGAIKILQTKSFKLTGAVDPKHADAKHQKGKAYYLSTSRNPSNDYAKHNAGYSVMFNLNGRWFNQRYKSVPVDYWERMWLSTLGTQDFRASEQEDRILSDKPIIPFENPNDVIDEIHIMVAKDRYKSKDEEYSDQQRNAQSTARKIVVLAKQMDIPVFLYNELSDFLTQNKNKSLPLTYLKAQNTEIRSYNDRINIWLQKWIELYHKKDQKSLSKEADKLRYNLIYSYSNDDLGLNNDMSNARKPGAYGYEYYTQLVKIMRDENLKTPVELAQFLKDKWKNINETVAGAVATVATPLGSMVSRMGKPGGSPQKKAKKKHK